MLAWFFEDAKSNSRIQFLYNLYVVYCSHHWRGYKISIHDIKDGYSIQQYVVKVARTLHIQHFPIEFCEMFGDYNEEFKIYNFITITITGKGKSTIRIGKMIPLTILHKHRY